MTIGSSPLIGQKHISGIIKNGNTGEVIIGAYIYQKGNNNIGLSDNNGYFSLIVARDSVIQVSYIGYELYTLNVISLRDTLLQISMTPKDNRLEEVVVRSQGISKFNVSTLNTIEMQSIPSLGGKPDVLKSLQLLPGIRSQNEASSILVVRGGSPGENLYLFDNVPVIYVNHLGGFTSVFNSDMINKIEIFKGGFPARYGGKLSSIVDITQREGDNSEIKGSLGIGITDASFSIEGPLSKQNKITFIITGRKTLIDPLMALSSSISKANDYIISYGFHDLNGKFSWRPNERNSLNLNLYQGDDYLNYWSKKDTNDTGKNHLINIWGNWLVSGRWNRLISTKLYAVNSISYTRYRLKNIHTYTIDNDSESFNYNQKYISSVQDIEWKSDFKYNIHECWSINFGLQSSAFFHIPNYAYTSNLTTQQKKETIKSFETVLYNENKIVLPWKIEANIGVRLINYTTKGFTNASLEPRIDLIMGLNNNQKLNLNYMKVNQFSHLLVTSGSIMSNEVWVPADKKIAPAISNQVSAGWAGSFFNNILDFELDLYFKRMSNLSTYKEGYSNLMGDTDWRSKIETLGKGTALGAEFLIKKKTGKWTGFMSYTYSKATRQFPNINQGRKYVYEYDRPHSVSISLSHQFTKKLSFNFVWIYQSGLPFTPAIGRQYTPSLKQNEDGKLFYYEVLIYGERNSKRMNDYHRLDLGLNYIKLTKKNRTAIWNFSLYNAYNRHNPYYYYYNTNDTNEIIKPENGGELKNLSLYQMSIFPIMPTISYKLLFERNTSIDKEQKSNVKQKFINWLFYEK
jgi:hypothetical protein